MLRPCIPNFLPNFRVGFRDGTNIRETERVRKKLKKLVPTLIFGKRPFPNSKFPNFGKKFGKKFGKSKSRLTQGLKLCTFMTPYKGITCSQLSNGKSYSTILIVTHRFFQKLALKKKIHLHFVLTSKRNQISLFKNFSWKLLLKKLSVGKQETD